jgi:hypothetical protein
MTVLVFYVTSPLFVRRFCDREIRIRANRAERDFTSLKTVTFGDESAVGRTGRPRSFRSS